jgi:hypothetical protein
MECDKRNARIMRLDAFGKKCPNSLLKIRLCFSGRDRARIESELVAVEEEGQLYYFILGNSPFGISVF